METKKQWNDIFKHFKEKYCQTKILSEVNLPKMKVQKKTH